MLRGMGCPVCKLTVPVDAIFVLLFMVDRLAVTTFVQGTNGEETDFCSQIVAVGKVEIEG